MDATDDNGLTPIVLTLYLGQPYRYQRKNDRGEVLWTAHYAPLFFAYHGRTDTDLVTYVGLDGPDRDKHFVCELADWAVRFTRVVPAAEVPAVRMGSPRAAEHPPQKVAGAFMTGSGV